MIGWVSLRASVASSVRLSSTSRLSPPSSGFLVFLCSISRASAMASFEEEDRREMVLMMAQQRRQVMMSELVAALLFPAIAP